MQQQVLILGSTGSIGTNTLEVIDNNPAQYKVFGLTAKENVAKLLQQCIKYQPRYALILDQEKHQYLVYELKKYNIKTQCLSTIDELINLIAHNDLDIVMAAIVGIAGMMPVYHAILNNKKVLLANKEALVVGGKYIMQALKNSTNAKLIPVDSEHNAIFQCLNQQTNASQVDYTIIKNIILTASGGALRDYSQQELANITVAQALAHPNWSMGKKVTIDSSTLMNKVLELIEAYWLFGQNASLLKVIIHPQSIIHSMVEYIDGSVIAQLGVPDMKTPISYALAYPKRCNSGAASINWTTLSSLTFLEPDISRFPCLNFAFEILKENNLILATVLNAANEILVDAFIKEQIKFYDISNLLSKSLNKFNNGNLLHYNSIESLLQLDLETRSYVLQLI